MRCSDITRYSLNRLTYLQRVPFWSTQTNPFGRWYQMEIISSRYRLPVPMAPNRPADRDAIAPGKYWTVPRRSKWTFDPLVMSICRRWAVDFAAKALAVSQRWLGPFLWMEFERSQLYPVTEYERLFGLRRYWGQRTAGCLAFAVGFALCIVKGETLKSCEFQILNNLP